MTIDAAPLDPTDPSFRASKISRRSLIAGLGFGAAAIAVAKTGHAAGAVAGQLDGPGEALAPAQRVTTTTTTTTVPTSTTSVVPIEGEIPFPIIVGEDDSCYVLKNFGDCRSNCSRRHEGVDIMADRGLEVVAVADGTLTKIYEDSGLQYGAGNGWTLTDEVNGIVYKYFHLDSHAEGLEVDDTVTAGQVIGYIGETGTTGANSEQENFHLHFEYRPNDVASDSFDLLARPEFVVFGS